jgi:hypothetical protein
MAVPWLMVGQLVLSNLDKIIAVVKPGFTRRRADVTLTPGAGGGVPGDLVSQQIAELQTASALNSEQIAALATQLKDVVAAIEQAGQEAVRQRAAVRRIALLSGGIAIAAIIVAMIAMLSR